MQRKFARGLRSPTECITRAPQDSDLASLFNPFRTLRPFRPGDLLLEFPMALSWLRAVLLVLAVGLPGCGRPSNQAPEPNKEPTPAVTKRPAGKWNPAGGVITGLFSFP